MGWPARAVCLNVGYTVYVGLQISTVKSWGKVWPILHEIFNIHMRVVWPVPRSVFVFAGGTSGRLSLSPFFFLVSIYSARKVRYKPRGNGVEKSG